MGDGCLAGLVVFLLVLISAFCVVCGISGWLVLVVLVLV